MRTIALKLNNLQFDSALVLNTMLLAASALLLVYYIIGANNIASDNYRIKLFIDRLTQLNEEQSNLFAQKTMVDESAVIRSFAQSHNMVEVKNISYIFESSNVAQR